MDIRMILKEAIEAGIKARDKKLKGMKKRTEELKNKGIEETPVIGGGYITIPGREYFEIIRFTPMKSVRVWYKEDLGMTHLYLDDITSQELLYPSIEGLQAATEVLRKYNIEATPPYFIKND